MNVPGHDSGPIPVTYHANAVRSQATPEAMQALNPMDPDTWPPGTSVELRGGDFTGTAFEDTFRNLADANGIEDISEVRLVVSKSTITKATPVPELRIIAAHLGGQFFWETIWAMSKCPNVYADLSGGTVRYFPAEFFRMLFLRVRRNDTTGSAVVDPDSADDQPCPPIRKLVFGSDNPDDTLEFYRQFMIALDVPAENRELIYHGNAEKLLAT